MQDKKNSAEFMKPGRGEYRDKNDEIVKQNSTGQRADPSEEGISNSRDRLENAEPFINDPNHPTNKKIARNNGTQG